MMGCGTEPGEQGFGDATSAGISLAVVEGLELKTREPSMLRLVVPICHSTI